MNWNFQPPFKQGNGTHRGEEVANFEWAARAIEFINSARYSGIEVPMRFGDA